MLNVGLTGGIGSGKSAASSRLRGLGAVVIDSDALSREVVEPGTPGLAAVVDRFGRGILDPSGRLDRAALAAIVFNDADARRSLNGIVHPLVRQYSEQLRRGAPDDAVIINDIPLLVEGGMAAAFHLVIVVAAPESVRIERLTGARGMKPADVGARISAQATDAQRDEVADVVLDNSGDLDGLHAQIDGVWRSRLLPFARNLSAQIAAGERISGRDGDIRRVAARLQYGLRDLVATVGFDDGLRVSAPSGIRDQVEDVLAALGWFREDPRTGILRSSDPASGCALKLILDPTDR